MKNKNGKFLYSDLADQIQNQIKYHQMIPQKICLDDLVHQLTEDMGNPKILKLGGVVVAPEHLPWKRLRQHSLSQTIVASYLWDKDKDRAIKTIGEIIKQGGDTNAITQ